MEALNSDVSIKRRRVNVKERPEGAKVMNNAICHALALLYHVYMA